MLLTFYNLLSISVGSGSVFFYQNGQDGRDLHVYRQDGRDYTVVVQTGWERLTVVQTGWEKLTSTERNLFEKISLLLKLFFLYVLAAPSVVRSASLPTSVPRPGGPSPC
jgi:hypothetical protein